MAAIQIQVSRAALDVALARARDIGPDTVAPALASPTDAAFWGRIGEVWDRVERAIKESFMRGREMAKALVDQAVKAAEAALAELKSKARELEAVLLDKIQGFLATFVDQALMLIRPAVTVGGRSLPLTGVEVEHRVSLGGSLKASILEACEIAAEGEFAVVGHYGVGS